MNLTEQLLHALKKHGAQQIFGIPGDFALPYFRIIEESQILPLYTLSHEPGVGFAAVISFCAVFVSPVADWCFVYRVKRCIWIDGLNVLFHVHIRSHPEFCTRSSQAPQRTH